MRATNNISRSFGKADAAVASIGPTSERAAPKRPDPRISSGRINHDMDDDIPF